ncbi:MAG: aminoacyl-tRNA deacylase [Chloroflexota bacterium]|jgi:Cys-tRNA(Pro)/Cys-tRNA(Cys) deacylase|nr:aminoacyl-tRNA deacylase [Aggregatilineaceae bacterium]
MAHEHKKLNAMRFLETQGVAYETFTYDPAILDGVHAAEAMGQPVEQVFKTLVVQLGKGDHALVMVPAGRALDLKKFARAIGEKKATMTTQRGAEAATGLRKGGIGALALAHKRWGVYLDESAQQFDAILVNGGERGVNLKVPVADLVRVLNARVVDVTTEDGGAGHSPGDADG